MKNGKISILQVINTARIGGGMRHLYALLQHLPRARYHLAVVAENGGFLVDEINRLDIPIHFIPLMRSRFDPAAVWRIARLARAEGADLLHLHGTRAGFFGAVAKRLAGVRHSIYTVHGFSFHKDIGPGGRAFYLGVERFCARAHSRLISVSGTDRDEAIRLGVCPPAQIETIYNGIDFSAFDPQRANGFLRHQLDVTPDALLVGTVARLVPQKGVEYFLEMARLVKQRCPQVRFVVIGEGELERTLKQRADQMGLDGHVLFAGAQEQMADCYAGLDVFVLSSLWEGHPLSLIESLAMECPTVATRTSGSPEIIDDGETGFLVAPKDPHQMADKVCWLLENAAQGRAMAREGRKRCRDRFDERHMVDQTLHMYEEILKGAR
ncbi:MAG TPA: glycosyltransferase family 4 protein [bacterium]|nr:glycosyltransferase family 4 protein [bacterium]